MNLLLLYFVAVIGICNAGLFFNKEENDRKVKKFMKFKDVHIKFDVPGAYYSIPLTSKEAKEKFSKKYAHAGYDNELKVDLYSYENDPRFFVLYDHYGNIAGVRLGFIKSDLPLRAIENKKEFPVDYAKLGGLYESGTFWDKEIFYTSVLFVDPAIIKKGGREHTNGIVAEDAWVKLEGKWTPMPRDQCEAEDLEFKKQACFLGMGMHYFYKMTPTTDCNEWRGVFLLYECGELIGLGFVPFGSHKTSMLKRTWYEDPPSWVVKMIVPNRPECLTEYVDNYGTNAMHIFFKPYPRTTQCTWPFQKDDQCDKK